MKVMTPKPRKAKNVSATLDTMSPNGVAGEGQEVGVDVGQRRHREHREDAEHDDHDDGLGLATVLEPKMLRTDITRTTATAKTFTHAVLPSATASLA